MKMRIRRIRKIKRKKEMMAKSWLYRKDSSSAGFRFTTGLVLLMLVF